MNAREKAMKLRDTMIDSGLTNVTLHCHCHATMKCSRCDLDDLLTSALTVPEGYVRTPDGVDHPACSNCGAWWDRVGRCPLCMNTVEESALAAKKEPA